MDGRGFKADHGFGPSFPPELVACRRPHLERNHAEAKPRRRRRRQRLAGPERRGRLEPPGHRFRGVPAEPRHRGAVRGPVRRRARAGAAPGRAGGGGERAGGRDGRGARRGHVSLALPRRPADAAGGAHAWDPRRSPRRRQRHNAGVRRAVRPPVLRAPRQGAPPPRRGVLGVVRGRPRGVLDCHLRFVGVPTCRRQGPAPLREPHAEHRAVLVLLRGAVPPVPRLLPGPVPFPALRVCPPCDAAARDVPGGSGEREGEKRVRVGGAGHFEVVFLCTSLTAACLKPLVIFCL